MTAVLWDGEEKRPVYVSKHEIFIPPVEINPLDMEGGSWDAVVRWDGDIVAPDSAECVHAVALGVGANDVHVVVLEKDVVAYTGLEVRQLCYFKVAAKEGTSATVAVQPPLGAANAEVVKVGEEHGLNGVRNSVRFDLTVPEGTSPGFYDVTVSYVDEGNDSRTGKAKLCLVKVVLKGYAVGAILPSSAVQTVEGENRFVYSADYAAQRCDVVCVSSSSLTEWAIEGLPTGVGSGRIEISKGKKEILRLTGLPSDCTGFEDVNVNATVKGTELATLPARLFFRARATDHPGEGSGNTANLYYYWAKEGAADGKNVCKFSRTDPGTYASKTDYAAWGGEDGALCGKHSDATHLITLFAFVVDPDARQQTFIEGVASEWEWDACTAANRVNATLAHERMHRFLDLDTDVQAMTDTDGDDIPDVWESVLGMKPGLDTYGSKFKGSPGSSASRDEEFFCHLLAGLNPEFGYVKNNGQMVAASALKINGQPLFTAKADWGIWPGEADSTHDWSYVPPDKFGNPNKNPNWEEDSPGR